MGERLGFVLFLMIVMRGLVDPMIGMERVIFMRRESEWRGKGACTECFISMGWRF